MGQYFKGCYRKQGEKLYNGVQTWALNNGAKLMEHGYIGNVVPGVIMRLARKEPVQIVWAGDYGPVEEEFNGQNIYDACVVLNDTEGGGTEETKKMVDKIASEIEKGGFKDEEEYPILFNTTKKQFVDLAKVPLSYSEDYKNRETGEVHHYEGKINPLVLLCEGGSNGDGGGDYFAEAGKEFIGTWKGDFIQVLQRDSKLYEGAEEIEPGFSEMEFSNK